MGLKSTLINLRSLRAPQRSLSAKKGHQLIGKAVYPTAAIPTPDDQQSLRPSGTLASITSLLTSDIRLDSARCKPRFLQIEKALGRSQGLRVAGHPHALANQGKENRLAHRGKTQDDEDDHFQLPSKTRTVEHWITS